MVAMNIVEMVSKIREIRPKRWGWLRLEVFMER